MKVFPGGRGLAVLLLVNATAGLASAQDIGSSTRNLQTVGRAFDNPATVPGEFTAMTLDQDSGRPFAYVGGRSGWSIVDISTGNPTVLQTVPSETAVSDIEYLQLGPKTFVAVAAGDEVHILDVTNPASTPPARVGNCPGGASATLFAYRHSDGRALLSVSAGGDAAIYDAANLIAGGADAVAVVRTPEQPDPEASGFERSYLAYHADTETDRFYGAGAGGYHVFDVTNTDSVNYVTSATPAAVRRGHMVSATPDGRYLLAGAEYRAAPLRIFDLQAALDGKLSVVRTSDGAWTHDWTSFLLAHELRWPLVFVAAGERGLQVFNMRDPEEPYTYAYLSTSAAPQGSIDDRVADVNGAVDVDVRNWDGLIGVLDRETGLWLARLDAFQGWDGRGYGLPNISSVQNWESGPDGTTSFKAP